MVDVSIIIVSWNTRDLLSDCIVSVCEQAGDINHEVIVVDNASMDDSADMVKKQFPQVLLIKNKRNIGFAAANNQGIRIAKGRYVLLLNSDTIVLNNAIAKTVSFADVHPEVAVVGCRVLNPDKTLQPTCFMFPSILNMFLSSAYLYKLFPKSKFFGRERMTWWGRNDIREVDVITGCFMLVRRKAIDQVGEMDEAFFMYSEETDWCYRFKQADWKILFTPDAQIIHFGGQSSKQIAPKMTLQLRGSILQFVHKHRSRLEYKLACALVWLFFAVRIPVWFTKALLKRQDRRYCRMRMKVYIKGVRNLISGGRKALCASTN